MSDEYVHLIVGRLTPHSVVAGVVNPDGLTYDELRLICHRFDEFIDVFTTSMEPALRAYEEQRRKVIPFPKK